jgi:hypothetical protein
MKKALTVEPGWVIVAYALLASGLAISDGHDHPVGIFLVLASALGVLAALFGVAAPVLSRSAPAFSKFLNGTTRADAVWAIALFSILLGFMRRPGDFIEPQVSLIPYYGLLGTAAALVLTSRTTLFVTPRLMQVRVCALVLVGGALGLWMLHSSPRPVIDVWPLHQQGAVLFLGGHSVYAPGSVHALDTFTRQRIIGEYSYPPLNIVMTSLGYLVRQETRDAQWLSMMITAVLVRAIAIKVSVSSAASRSARSVEGLPDALLTCMLFHPRALYVLEQAWGEPLALPLLAGCVLAFVHEKNKTAAILLGLLCALKQYFILYLPALMLLRGAWQTNLSLSMLTLALTYLPFVLFTREGMWAALVLHHVHNPFRPDSLSIPAFLSSAKIFVPTWLGPLLALASFWLLRLVRRGVAELVLASSVTLFCFFLFGRQAFANYYYLLNITILIALSAVQDSKTTMV